MILPEKILEAEKSFLTDTGIILFKETKTDSNYPKQGIKSLKWKITIKFWYSFIYSENCFEM